MATLIKFAANMLALVSVESLFYLVTLIVSEDNSCLCEIVANYFLLCSNGVLYDFISCYS